jgi:hypothetical protein
LHAFTSYETTRSSPPYRRFGLFETGWATKAKWLSKNVLILHAEIYPSLREPSADELKDRGQVRAIWQWARDLDCDNLL